MKIELNSEEVRKTLTLYRDAVRRHQKFTAYNLSQPAGLDLGYDRMVDWASETDRAFVEHVKELHAQLVKSEKEGNAVAADLADMETAKDELFDEALAYKVRAERAEKEIAMMKKDLNRPTYDEWKEKE